MRLVIAALVLLASASTSTAEPDSEPSYTELVAQLGHPLYPERRDARRRLLSAGLAAFDDLRAGRESLDPEVADASAALLGDLTSSWAWPGDSLRARLLLSDFGELPPGARLAVLARLARQPNQEGVAALVRLARFAPSDRIARWAAAELLAGPDHVLDQRRRAVIGLMAGQDYVIGERWLAAIERADAELRDQFGPPRRDASRWLSAAASDRRSAAGSLESVEDWRRFTEEQQAELRRGQSGAVSEVVATLAWQWLRAALRADSEPEAIEAVAALQSLEPELAAQRIRHAVLWAIDAERPAIGRALASAFESSLDGKRALYVLAELATASGDAERAAGLAAEALGAEVVEFGDSELETLGGSRVKVGRELISRGRYEWALAEYREAMDVDDPLNGEAATARWRLVDRLFDAARYEEAAALLRELREAIEASPGGKKRYAELPQARSDLILVRGFDELRAREGLSTALAAREADDREVEIAALRKAIAADPGDADIVIAMHQVTDPPADFAAATRGHIERLCRRFEEQIWDPDTSDSRSRSGPYNQWAWLVSNTEGDFDKAVRYSRNSLRMLPETGGYLDTLGRCYFSAGRLEEAIATQRRAIELEPHYEVMRRQLAEFEAALTNREASE